MKTTKSFDWFIGCVMNSNIGEKDVSLLDAIVVFDEAKILYNRSKQSL